VSTPFVCQFNIEGQVKQVNAQLLGNTIYCESLEFSYIDNQTNISSKFDVLWDGSKPLDNPDNIHGIDAYDCPLESIFSCDNGVFVGYIFVLSELREIT
jgi:plexin A